MGNANNCDGRRTLNTENDANATIINGKDRNHCTISGSLGNQYHEKFCDAIGDNEWTRGGGTGSCNYNNSNNIERWEGSGCCQTSCSILGSYENCKRIASRGEYKSCCLRDYACNGLNNIKTGLGNFDSSETDSNGNALKERSCPNDSRSLTAPKCRQYITDLCGNLDTGNSNPSWRANWLSEKTVSNPYDTFPTGGHTSGINVWNSPSNAVCLHALYRNLYGVNNYGCMGVAPPTIESGIQVFPTTDGLIYGRQLVQNLFDTYINEGGNLGAGPGDEADSEMNDLLWTICSTIPGVCTTSLNQFCSTITTNDLIRNPNLQKWCGCYMPDFEYAKYTNLYGISKQCTPQCNVAGLIPVVDETGIKTLKCEQSTCVIDDISIQLYEAKVGTDTGNGISISQICGSCGSGSNTGTCQCSLTGLNFAAVDATVPSLEISQACSGGSICYFESTDSTGNVISTPIPCSSDLGFDPTQSAQDSAAKAQQDADRWRNTKIIILFVIVITVLIIIWIIFSPYSLAEEKRIYQRNEPKFTTTLTPNGGGLNNNIQTTNSQGLTPINSNSYINNNPNVYNELTPINSNSYISNDPTFRSLNK
jgi:hypothetical protein